MAESISLKARDVQQGGVHDSGDAIFTPIDNSSFTAGSINKGVISDNTVLIFAATVFGIALLAKVLTKK